MSRPARILPAIIFSQFAGASVWFAGNAVLPDIQSLWDLPEPSIGWITSAVQFGFISGTLLFALFSLADRFKAKKIFLICCMLNALTTSLATVIPPSLAGLLILRFLTGFFLAGIYPVGMKIAAEWYKEGLGRAMGWLVGALVLGTAFPHLLKGLAADLPWENVLLSISLLSGLGGLAMFVFVSEGPNARQTEGFNPKAMFQVFKSEDFRRAATGYFGHMWELYAFWAFVPLLIMSFNEKMDQSLSISLWSFFAIGSGALGCIIGGQISLKRGSPNVAFYMLLTSAICCLLSLFATAFHPVAFMAFIIIWGFAVVGDSPQFSALNAKTAPEKLVGTALTIVTSIGFAVTIVSIELLNYLITIFPVAQTFLFLIPGPLLGLAAINKLRAQRLSSITR